MLIVNAAESLMKDTSARLGIFRRRTTQLHFWSVHISDWFFINHRARDFC